MKWTTFAVVLAVAAGASAGACSKKPERAQITPEATEIFTTRCATCHGTEGRGNGPASAALNPKPRNYTDKSWQASVSDEQIKKTIVLGGAAVGKSPIMPASPDLEQNPQTLDAMVSIVRKFGD